MCHFLYYRLCCYASDPDPYGTSLLPVLRATLDLTTREGTISVLHSVKVGDAYMKYIPCYGTPIFITLNRLSSKINNSPLGSINLLLLRENGCFANVSHVQVHSSLVELLMRRRLHKMSTEQFEGRGYVLQWPRRTEVVWGLWLAGKAAYQGFQTQEQNNGRCCRVLRLL